MRVLGGSYIVLDSSSSTEPLLERVLVRSLASVPTKALCTSTGFTLCTSTGVSFCTSTGVV